MKAFKFGIFSLLLLSATIFSCSKSGGSGGAGKDTLTATVDGKSFNSSLTTSAVKDGSAISIAGTGSDGQINIGITSYTGPGTYSVSDKAIMTFATTSLPIEAWSANPVVGEGSVTITKDDDNYVEGTFNFKAYSSGGASSKTVSGGKFNVKLK
ncbi:MAG: hypothetical protein H3C36_04395 [Chitinophagaceae bacterium]|nr:hypothetical protein [Chitinophagaceae bacterium]MCW5914067.1 hypothetical protein [Chitinophagaceae bacterium]MCZ2396048.1 hypothetical protein [Chitinophagales bacterium]